jgi:hypothetical protein
MVAATGGDLPAELQAAARALLDRYADEVDRQLVAKGLPKYAAGIFSSWNLYVLVDSSRTLAVFSVLQGGVAGLRWLHQPQASVSLEQLVAEISTALRQEVLAAVSLSSNATDLEITAVASAYMDQLERENRLARLGDITGFAHLEQPLRSLLLDHPEPSRNVFLMMRFDQSPQLDSIAAAIRETLAAHALVGLRADDRDYADELWSNVQTYMLACELGIAVFEQIDQRDFNPNVSLELGFMLARRKRCLLLKEKRLPSLHADLVGKLYKPFDAFDIASSVRQQVQRWVEVDLGLS